jgi:shikimate dehydrogenase
VSLTGAARVAGIVGAPVTHSLSPFLHGRWIAAAGLDAAYVPFACPPDRFATFIEGLRGGTIVGLNITAPFKREALAIAHTATKEARACGSANLLLFHPDGTIEARSTDGYGVLTALARRAPALTPAQGPATILGAGGAAAAAAAALVGAGWKVQLVARTPATAQAVAAATGARLYAWDDCGTALAEAALLINAVPGDPQITSSPGIAAFDMSYTGHDTPFLARATGPRIHGIDMLIAQAEPSFEAFYDVPPPPIDQRAAAVGILTGSLKPAS